MRSTPAFLAAALLLAACDDNDPIDCETNADCSQAGIPGTCLPSPVSSTMWCAFPDNSCASGDRWGILTGDGLARECVDGSDPDAGVDASTADSGPDAAADPPVTTILVGATSSDSVYVFDANTLAPGGSFSLPDPQAQQRTRQLVFEDGTIWAVRNSDVVAIDTTFLVRAGYPKVVPSSQCDVDLGRGAAGGSLFCSFNNQTTQDTNDDLVRVLSLSELTPLMTYPVPNPGRIAGDSENVVVVHGATNRSVGVFDTSLAPAPGSPVTTTTATAGPIEFVAASSSLNRFAFSIAMELEMYNLTTLGAVGDRRTFAAYVGGFVFDEERGQVVVGLSNGNVVALSAADGSELVAPVDRADSGLFGLVVDKTHDRILISAGAKLIVLDATTLQHVAGSPVTLTEPGSTIGLF